MSLTVTVAPKTTFSVERFEVSMICASASLCSRSRIRASMWLWRSLAAWNSAFSLRSPWPLASSISLMFLGRSTFFNRSSSLQGRVSFLRDRYLHARSSLRLRSDRVVLLQGLDGQLPLQTCLDRHQSCPGASHRSLV